MLIDPILSTKFWLLVTECRRLKTVERAFFANLATQAKSDFPYSSFQIFGLIGWLSSDFINEKGVVGLAGKSELLK